MKYWADGRCICLHCPAVTLRALKIAEDVAFVNLTSFSWLMDVRICIIPHCLQSYMIQALALYCTLAGLSPREFIMHAVPTRIRLVHTLYILNYRIVKMFGTHFFCYFIET